MVYMKNPLKKKNLNRKKKKKTTCYKKFYMGLFIEMPPDGIACIVPKI